MGQSQDLLRNYSVLSVLGVGFSLVNAWFGISAALITGINSGGPVLIVYGLILIALISLCVGISLSELVSAYPNAGGQYFWANELASRRYANFASYLTGWFAWAGSIFTSASIAIAVGSGDVGCWQLAHPDFVVRPWHVFLGYQTVNIFAFFFNCYGRILPTMGQLTFWTSLLSFITILVIVPSKAPTHQDAKFVFATFVNNTGWKNNGIAFIVGLINPNWAFAGLDCATHLAEEIHHPEKMIPIAILGTVAISFVTSWTYAIALFFSMKDVDSLVDTATGVPILALFYQIIGNKAGAIALEALIMATGVGCQIACHTWQSRLCWSFARDGGIPCSSYFCKVDRRLNVPLRAHFMSCILVAIVGCLYLGSYTAFNSMITACIVCLYISYSIPVICLLLRGRNNIPHGPFWMGPIGLVSNIVLLLWTSFTLIMYSFPPVLPVQAGNMNYVSAVYAILVLIIVVDWFARGRREYKSQDERNDEAAAPLLRGSVSEDGDDRVSRA
ncbi:MAG: hypothetical protein LQ349_005065 [Xanthoria aureola]|nr:MAG: hypothetical protein LQ349_005065 [Xanthoria aureola]